MSARRRSTPDGGAVRTVVLLAVVVVAAAVALATSGTGRPSPASQSLDPQTGRLVFELERFDGGVLTSAELLGTPAVLNGYASWCSVCRREMPDFEAVHRAAGDRLAVIGFNPQSNDTDAAQARLVRDTGVTYPTVRDPGDGLLRRFVPSGGLPVTVFLDADGVVREVHRGLLTEQALRDEVRRLFGIEL